MVPLILGNPKLFKPQQEPRALEVGLQRGAMASAWHGRSHVGRAEGSKENGEDGCRGCGSSSPARSPASAIFWDW